MCPSTSWVAKWNDKSRYIPGVYALKVNDSEQMEVDDNDNFERVHRTKEDDDDSMDEGGNEIM